jgi:DNA-binding transcriptional ArsR family regulator
VDSQLAKALSHPLRISILEVLEQEMASPTELSKKLKCGLSKMGYHVKVLRDTGLIQQVRTVPRRGAMERFYRASHDGRQLNCIHAELDAKGCEEVSTAVDAAVSKVRVAQERSARRLAKEKAEGVPATIIVASFESGIKSGDGANADR